MDDFRKIIFALKVQHLLEHQADLMAQTPEMR